VEETPCLVGEVVDALLDLALGLIELALVLQVFVPGQVACGLLDPAFGVIGVAVRRLANIFR
jgi:hypothetical protein